MASTFRIDDPGQALEKDVKPEKAEKPDLKAKIEEVLTQKMSDVKTSLASQIEVEYDAKIAKIQKEGGRILYWSDVQADMPGAIAKLEAIWNLSAEDMSVLADLRIMDTEQGKWYSSLSKSRWDYVLERTASLLSTGNLESQIDALKQQKEIALNGLESVLKAFTRGLLDKVGDLEKDLGKKLSQLSGEEQRELLAKLSAVQANFAGLETVASKELLEGVSGYNIIQDILSQYRSYVPETAAAGLGAGVEITQTKVASKAPGDMSYEEFQKIVDGSGYLKKKYIKGARELNN